ncbi:histidine phosphatase family protein [Agromyces archimandritae]|uniref:Histidine phosphatase family protein n=1 Tax=Agromyces archimandritae TaxID=2781962 RepID=A0A975IMR4_9MICO|nr:histidine phosphatase family protein [Agromyces archimandritae]QTX03802.1 histidine phosphatase family protein [Agromyces archimandritae]
MTTFFLARHGETVWHAEHRYAGNSDVALTRHGLGQAAALGAWAVDAALDAIVASPLSRAKRSAAPSAETTGLELRVDARLTEIDFGEAEGLSPAELEARLPEAWAAFREAPATQPFPGGESGRDGVARALPVFNELAEEFPDGRVLIVAHATLIRLLFCELAGMDPDGYRDLLPVLGNCTVTTVVYPWATESRAVHRPRIRLLGYDVPPWSAGP